MSQDLEAVRSGAGHEHDSGVESGRLGTRHVVFFVVAAAAPLGFAVGTVPLALGRGGIGTASMFLVVGAFLAIFASGFTAMSRYIVNGGAFFSYIAAGLGRPFGLGTAFVATFAYAITTAGSLGAFAVFAAQACSTLIGVSTPWQFWAFAGVGGVGILGILNVDLNLRVLGILMIIEVGALSLLSICIIAAGGAEGLSFEAFRPQSFHIEQIGVVLLIVFAAFAGFEATALFREEVRDPALTVRRATFIAIALIAFFQAFVCWSIIQAFGSHAVAAAIRNPTQMYALAADKFVGRWFVDLVAILVVGSWLASIIAFHNITARYLLMLGRDHAIPVIFSRRSERTGAPWVASLTHSAICAMVVLFCSGVGLDPYLDLFVISSVPVAVGIPAMECLTAFSIFVFFWTDRRDESLWAARIAPAISAVGLLIVLYFVLVNLPIFTGRSGALNWYLPGIDAVLFLLGIARAQWLRKFNHARYAKLGHWGENS